MPAVYVDGGAQFYESNQGRYSTGDYCESPDSCSHRKTDTVDCLTSPRPSYPLPLHPRCSKKYYRIANNANHLPKPKYSSKQILRPSVRRPKRERQIEETTSLDEHRSITSYSSILTVDVNREMEAVNRDIQEIIRRCDDYCQQVTNHSDCCRHRHRKIPTKASEVRLISLKRRPADRLKEMMPASVIKPKAFRRHYAKEKSLSVSPHTRCKTPRDIRNIVEETDALLRNVYKELSRGKRQQLLTEYDGCRCDSHPAHHDPTPGWTAHYDPTRASQRLDKFMAYHKCPRLRLDSSRLLLPRWKHIFERSLTKDEWTGHNHDTNCISDSSCFLRTKGALVKLKDAQVNTDSVRDTPFKEYKCLCQGKPLSRRSDAKERKEIGFDSVTLPADDKTVGKDSNYKSEEVDLSLLVSGCDRSTAANENQPQATSLLLDRDMGLALNTKSKINKTNESTDSGVQIASSKELGSTLGPRKRYYSHDYSGIVGKNSGGASDESITALESSKTFITQMVTKIVSTPSRRGQSSPVKTLVDSDNLEKRDGAVTQEVDSSICLEIMKRLVDLIMNNHQKQTDRFVDVPAQYARVRKMKQEHLINIEREINSIQDLEFYLRNATLSKT